MGREDFSPLEVLAIYSYYESVFRLKGLSGGVQIVNAMMETSNTSSIQSDPNHKESCRSCLYTGVSTCLGLSAYFLHLATEDDKMGKTSNEMQKTPNDIKQRQNSTVDKRSMKTTSRKTFRHIGSNASTATNIKSKTQSSSKIHKPISFQSQLNNFMKGKPIPKNNRPFLFAMGAVWAVAGSYRLYLN